MYFGFCGTWSIENILSCQREKKNDSRYLADAVFVDSVSLSQPHLDTAVSYSFVQNCSGSAGFMEIQRPPINSQLDWDLDLELATPG